MDLDELISMQSGVVSRAQLVASGSSPHDLARWVRRRQLRQVQRGIYVDHTGEPTWVQRAWVGCLAHAPAALAGPSALRVVQAGVGTTTRVRFTWRSTTRDESSSRMRTEEAVLDVALARLDRIGRISALADVCQAGRTTAARIAAALDARPRVSDRAWLTEVLTDIADGTCSTLEHGFLTLVERPHGLPRRCGRRATPPPWAEYAATWTTRHSPSPSSWTGGSSTTTPPSVIATSTSTPPGVVRCGWAGGRSTTDRAPPPPVSRGS